MGRIRGFGITVIGVMLFLSAACSSSEHWHLADVRHLIPDLDFALQGVDGQTVKAADFRGQTVLLYFGYTHCPDICPITLGKLRTVLLQLGKAGQRVRVLFVSVDPARDTPAVLKQYLAAFGTQFVGLVGTPEQTAAIAKRYRVGYNKEMSSGNKKSDDYSVAHSGGVFIFDGRGQAVLLGTQATPIADYVADLKQLLAAR